MKLRTSLPLAMVVAAAAFVGQFVVFGQPPGKADAPPEKGRRAQQFITAFNNGDAKGVAGFWTADGEYVDETGRAYKGRAAIQTLYEKLFAAQKGAKLEITVTSHKLVGTDVALEDGISEVTPSDGGAGSASRFSAVLSKKDGEWYFESVRESAALPPSNAAHFEDLEWLLGDWTGEETKGESQTASYEWAENRNFLVSSFATTLNGTPVVGGTQWIAYDAVEKQIRSFSFYSGGGIGEATWTKDGDSWLVKTVAKLANGKKAAAVNVLTRTDADHLTWQMTKLIVDGEAMPDSKPIKMKRTKE